MSRHRSWRTDADKYSPKHILIVIDVYEINHKRTAEMKSNEECPRSGT